LRTVDVRNRRAYSGAMNPLLSAAVVAFVGVAGRLDPRSPEQRVVAAVGDRGRDVLPAVQGIIDDVYGARPPLSDLQSIGEIADAVRAYLGSRHPELSDEAVTAVVNRFTYDWR